MGGIVPAHGGGGPIGGGGCAIVMPMWAPPMVPKGIAPIGGTSTRGGGVRARSGDGAKMGWAPDRPTPPGSDPRRPAPAKAGGGRCAPQGQGGPLRSVPLPPGIGSWRRETCRSTPRVLDKGARGWARGPEGRVLVSAICAASPRRVRACRHYAPKLAAQRSHHMVRHSCQAARSRTKLAKSVPRNRSKSTSGPLCQLHVG